MTRGGDHFDAYERDAWRFEAQPVYTMPKEAENVARFLRGDSKPPEHKVLDVSQDDHGLPLTGTDWWMFDGSRIVHLNFRVDGTQINRELFAGDTGPYLEWQRIALAHSVPFAEYVKRRPSDV